MSYDEPKEFECGRDVLQVGDLVSVAGCPEAGEVCLVYETYEDLDDASQRGVSLITSDGRDLGGWSFEEQGNYLTLVMHTDFEYQFRNVLQLIEDYRRGVFGPAFLQYSKQK